MGGADQFCRFGVKRAGLDRGVFDFGERSRQAFPALLQRQAQHAFAAVNQNIEGIELQVRRAAAVLERIE